MGLGALLELANNQIDPDHRSEHSGCTLPSSETKFSLKKVMHLFAKNYKSVVSCGP